jgi:hypothetical protein
MSKGDVVADGALIEHLWSSPFRKWAVDEMEACVSMVDVEMSHKSQRKRCKALLQATDNCTRTCKVTTELQKGAATETARSLKALSL